MESIRKELALRALETSRNAPTEAERQHAWTLFVNVLEYDMGRTLSISEDFPANNLTGAA